MMGASESLTEFSIPLTFAPIRNQNHVQCDVDVNDHSRDRRFAVAAGDHDPLLVL